MRERRRVWPWWRVLALATAVAALFVAGCDGDEGGATATTEPSASAVVSATATVAATSVPGTSDGTATVPPTVSATPQRLAIGLPLVAPQLGLAGDLDGDGLPSGVVGPLVVYQHEISSPNYADPWVPGTVEVVAVDLGRGGAEVGRVRFGGVQTPRVDLGGGRLVVEFGRVLRSYALDGSDGVELWRNEAGMIERIAASPDGSLVAMNEFERWDCVDLAEGCRSFGDENRLLVLDSRTGEVVLEVPQRDPRFDGFGGVAGPSVWEAGGDAVELLGYTYSEGGGGRARLGLDGTVTLVDDSGRYLRGSIEVVPEGALGCGLGPFDGWSMVRILDVASGATVNRYEAGAPLIDLLEIAPDGSEVLIGLAEPSEELVERLLDAQAAEECAPTGVASAVADAPRRLVLLGADGTQREVGSRLEVYRRWYAGAVVSFACGEVERAGFTAGAGTWWPGGGAYAIGHDGCEEPFELRVNGETVGAGDDLRVLGIVGTSETPG